VSAALPFPFPGARPNPLGYFQADAAQLAAAIDLATICGGMIPAGTVYALAQCETASVRWRDDGVAPTGSTGMLILDTDSSATGFQLSQFGGLSFILASGSPLLNVSVYGA
jgi:hypothetical protein